MHVRVATASTLRFLQGVWSCGLVIAAVILDGTVTAAGVGKYFTTTSVCMKSVIFFFLQNTVWLSLVLLKIYKNN
jgi:hypothetical protein